MYILHVQHWMLAKTEICWEENGVLKLTPNRGTSEEGRHLYHHHLGVLKVKRTNYNVTMSCKCTTTFVDHFHCSQTVEQGNPKLTCLWQQHIQIRFFLNILFDTTWPSKTNWHATENPNTARFKNRPKLFPLQEQICITTRPVMKFTFLSAATCSDHNSLISIHTCMWVLSDFANCAFSLSSSDPDTFFRWVCQVQTANKPTRGPNMKARTKLIQKQVLGCQSPKLLQTIRTPQAISWICRIKKPKEWLPCLMSISQSHAKAQPQSKRLAVMSPSTCRVFVYLFLLLFSIFFFFSSHFFLFVLSFPAKSVLIIITTSDTTP